MLMHRLVVAAAALTLALSPVAAAAVPAAGTTTTVGLSGAQVTGDGRAGVVADIAPMPARPLTADDVTVTAGGARLEATVAPLLSGRTSLSMVVDASAQSAESTSGGGLSGVATFLLQAPPEATLSVIADRQPPVLSAPPAVGVSAALTAASNLPSNGARATSDALTLALRQLTPGSPSVVVLYTAAADAGGEPAPALAARIRAAGAVLAVVTTGGDDRYWSAVAESTGGLALSTRSARAIATFDQLSDALGSRQLVTFPRPRPVAAPVTVGVRTSTGSASATVVMPPGPDPTGSGAGPESSGGVPWWAVALIGVGLLIASLVLITGLAAWWWRAARSTTPGPDPGSPQPERPPPSWPRPAEPAEPADRVGLPGVRVFDVDAWGEPTEITGSLFEPRSVRDARQAASPSLHERFAEIRASLDDDARIGADPPDDEERHPAR